MSITAFFEALIFLGLIGIGCYAMVHEREIARFERKIWRYVKAFGKAVYYTIKDKVRKDV